MLIQQTLIQYLLQKKNLCEIFKVLTIWGNINLFIRPQHHNDRNVKRSANSKRTSNKTGKKKRLLQGTLHKKQKIDLSSAPWTMHEFFARSGLVW